MESVPWPDMAFLPVKMFGEMPSPRILKSHSPYHMMAGGLPHTSPAKYIYIARNPKDTAVSYYYHVSGFLFNGVCYIPSTARALQIASRSRI